MHTVYSPYNTARSPVTVIDGADKVTIFVASDTAYVQMGPRTYVAADSLHYTDVPEPDGTPDETTVKGGVYASFNALDGMCVPTPGTSWLPYPTFFG